MVQCGEEVTKEVERYKSCLSQMFSNSEQGALFVETVNDAGNRRRHAHIDVLPVERSIIESGEVQMFFQQAFMTSGEEWSHQKKVIELSASKPLHKVIPRDFPYCRYIDSFIHSIIHSIY